MIRMLKCSTIALFAISLSACESAGTYDYSSQKDDMGMEADQGVQEDLGSSCEPLAMCPAASCGSIADGCGGQLDCGMCQCVGGQPQQEGCGTCDLGALSCDADVAKCDELPLPQLTPDQCAQRIYVSKQAQAGGDGTIQSPLQSIQAGIDAAKARGAKLVLVAGSDSFEESITLANGVSILGGFQPTTFKRDLSYRPILQPPDEGQDLVAILGQELTQPILISNMQVKTPDLSGPSASNYGVYLKGAKGVTLHMLDVQVGQGGDGLKGEDGAKGADGKDGGQAYCDVPDYDSGWVFNSGGGGANISCPMAGGGEGGDGGTSGKAARQGRSSASGVLGGAGGTNQAQGVSLNGKNGLNGQAPKERGGAGKGGTTSALFNSEAGYFVSEGLAGGVGMQGDFGQGGGGGGGAGTETDQSGRVWDGPYGSGGGAGGCGGEPGQGGGGGGGSFGLYTISSAVMIERSSWVAGSGGRGGHGGNGGEGGRGGKGGVGVYNFGEDINGNSTRPIGSCQDQYIPGGLDARSGDGGDGGDGAPGGHGGGGAGGPSIGAFCQESSLVSDTESKFSSAGRASGGQSLGIPGEDGLSVDVQGCR